MVGAIEGSTGMAAMFQGASGPGQGMGQVQGQLHARMLEKLSEQTGFDEQTLEAGFQDGSIRQTLESRGISREDMEVLRTEALEEMVASGEISESMASRMPARPQGPPPQRASANTGADMAASMQQVLEQIVQELGLQSSDELLSLLPEGTSLWSYVEENGGDLFSSESMFTVSA